MKDKTALFLIFFFLITMFSGCAGSKVKKREFELKFKKIDHFFVGKYEVGALEYESVILPKGFIQRYHFPVYVEGQREKDFYLNIYGDLEEFKVFAYKKVSVEFLFSQPLLWILEEKTLEDPHLIIKKYDGPVSYENVKKDLIRNLKGGM